jgi:hypothetical protein
VAVVSAAHIHHLVVHWVKGHSLGSIYPPA